MFKGADAGQRNRARSGASRRGRDEKGNKNKKINCLN